MAGSRGPIGNSVAETVQSRPEPPSWLSAQETHLFESLVDEAIRANGPVLDADAVVFANIARLQLAIQRERHPATSAKLMKTLLPWMQAAGLTASGRQRLGVKQKKEAKSKTAQLLAAVRRPA